LNMVIFQSYVRLLEGMLFHPAIEKKDGHLFCSLILWVPRAKLCKAVLQWSRAILCKFDIGAFLAMFDELVTVRCPMLPVIVAADAIEPGTTKLLFIDVMLRHPCPQIYLENDPSVPAKTTQHFVEFSTMSVYIPWFVAGKSHKSSI